MFCKFNLRFIVISRQSRLPPNLLTHHMIMHVPAKVLQPAILIAATFQAVRLSRLCIRGREREVEGEGPKLNWLKLPGRGPSWAPELNEKATEF